MPCIVQDSLFNEAIVEGGEWATAQGVVGAVPHRSFSYHRLPQKLLKLSVVKLDGSRFDVQVSRTASVAELKRRVEDVFNQSSEEGEGTISWSHVWGYFCLCYEDFKLINDKEPLRNFGIKDGDQLHFIRHLSIHYVPVDHLENHATARGQCTSPAQPNHGDEEIADDQCCKDDEYESKDNNLTNQREFKLAHFLRGWLQFSRLCFVGGMRSENFQRLASDDCSSDEEPRKLSLVRSQSSS